MLPLALLKSIKEAPSVMIIPVVLLALLAIFGGLLGFTFGTTPLLEEFLHEIGLTPIEEELHSGFVITPETWIAVAGAFLGVGAAAFIYTRYAGRLGLPLHYSENRFISMRPMAN